MEEDHKAQREEWSRVAASDKEVVEKASENAVRELLIMFCQVSSKVLWPLVQN